MKRLHPGSRWLLTGLAAVVTAAAVVACAGASPADDAETTLSLRATSVEVSWDPFNGGYASGVSEAVYEGLGYYNTYAQPATLTPRLADSFDLSEDGKTLRIALRDDVDFVDGEHMDAEGVKDYFDALFVSDGWVWNVGVVSTGVQVSVTGEYELELTTPDPMNSNIFGMLLTYTPIISPAAVADPSILADGPVGTGPYQVDEITSGEATFIRNPDYRDPESYPFDRVTYRLLEDDVAALNALKSGQITAANLQPTYALEAQNAGFALNTLVGTINQFQTLYVSDRAGTLQPALADLRVRQALNHAFDREAISKVLYAGLGGISSQPFSPAMPEYVDGGDDRYSYDPALAKTLLAEAGYADGFALTIPTGSPAMDYGIYNTAPIEPLVAQALTDIGIDVTFGDPVADLAQFQAMMKSGEYPVLMVPMYFSNLITNLSANGDLTVGGVPDPAIVGWLDLIKSGGPSESDAASQDLGNYILDEAWFAPFAVSPELWATASDVRMDTAQGNSLLSFQLAD